jgi:hypothetical protein
MASPELGSELDHAWVLAAGRRRIHIGVMQRLPRSERERTSVAPVSTVYASPFRRRDNSTIKDDLLALGEVSGPAMPFITGGILMTCV